MRRRHGALRLAHTFLNVGDSEASITFLDERIIAESLIETRSISGNVEFP